jgi:hypothetical protein
MFGVTAVSIKQVPALLITTQTDSGCSDHRIEESLAFFSSAPVSSDMQ